MKISRKTKLWFKASMVRAIKTIAQTMAGILTASTIFAEIDWKVCLSASFLAGLTSILTSIAGIPEVPFNYQPLQQKPKPKETKVEN